MTFKILTYAWKKNWNMYGIEIFWTLYNEEVMDESCELPIFFKFCVFSNIPTIELLLNNLNRILKPWNSNVFGYENTNLIGIFEYQLKLIENIDELMYFLKLLTWLTLEFIIIIIIKSWRMLKRSIYLAQALKTLNSNPC